MKNEESVSFFKCLKNLEKIWHSNGPSPTLHVVNKNSVTNSIGIGKSSTFSKQWCHFCDKNNHNMAGCRTIAKAKQQKQAPSEAKAVSGRKSLAFVFEEINAIKRQLKPPKIVIPRRGKLNLSSLWLRKLI
jgi:hypothetical protein